MKIVCPNCQQLGENRILGEYLYGTAVVIQRQHTRYSIDESTIIYGNDFYLVCGYCKFTIHIQAGQPLVMIPPEIGTQHANGSVHSYG